MTDDYETPDGWEQHEGMARAPGYLDAFRTPDHTHFIDIVEYRAHMDAEYRVEHRVAIGDEPRTACEKSVDCDDEAEAWDAAIALMEGADVGATA